MTASPLSLWTDLPAITPLSGAIVAAVLAFGDINEPVEDGLVRVSLSEARLMREDLRLLLAPDERECALDVAVLWHSGRGEIVRVIDAAQPAGQDRRRHGFPRLAA